MVSAHAYPTFELYVPLQKLLLESRKRGRVWKSPSFNLIIFWYSHVQTARDLDKLMGAKLSVAVLCLLATWRTYTALAVELTFSRSGENAHVALPNRYVSYTKPNVLHHNSRKQPAPAGRRQYGAGLPTRGRAGHRLYTHS